MVDVKTHLKRNIAQAEALGDTARVKRLKAKLVDLSPKKKAAAKVDAPKAEPVVEKKVTDGAE